jgi:hypothetical protein
MMRALDFISVITILTALVAAPFLLVGWFTYAFRRRESRVFPIKSTLFFAVPVAVGLLAGWTSDSITQDQTLDFLRSASAKASVSIDAHEVQNSDEILNALRSIRKLFPHHSDPTRTMRVEISDGTRSVLLLVARDSADPHEYWVFAPSPSKLALRWNLEKDIGHVITPVFDQY